MLPLYAQLKETLITAIERDELAPGDQLPSQRELCERYKMSHMTVRRAISDLINEGVIQSIHGKGLYVAEHKVPSQAGSLVGFYEHMRRLGKTPSNRLLDAKIMNASTVLGHKLNVKAGESLIYIRRLRFVDGHPMSVAASYLPQSLCPGLLTHDLVNNSLYAVLRDIYGLVLATSTAIIGAALADTEQAELLDAPLPAALITEEQITHLNDGRCIEFSRSVIRGDRYCFQLEENRESNSRTPVIIDHVS